MGNAFASASSVEQVKAPSKELHEAEAPVGPSYGATSAFDASNAAHVHAASQAHGHLFDDVGLAAPSSFELGDHAVGAVYRENKFVADNDGDEAYVRVGYEGDGAIVLEGGPNRLRPSHEGQDPGTAIRFAFAPQAKGHYHGTVTIDAAWPAGGRKPERLSIPVVAAAHAVGEPDLADQEAAQRDREQAEHAEAHDREQMAHAKAARDERLDHGKMSGTPVQREALHEAAEDAAGAMNRLLNTRHAGVQAADEEAMAYDHENPPYHQSLLEALALAALDVVTAGIAGTLAKKLEVVLTEKLVVEAHTVGTLGRASPRETYEPSKAVVAFFTDGVKDVVKLTGKAATPHGGEGHHADTSSTPRIDFFMREKVALAADNSLQAKSITDNARNVLEPMLDISPHQAIDAMRAIARQIETLSVSDETAGLQRRESALHWIRYVADTSLGTVDGQHADIAAANTAPSDRGVPPSRDGLVDIQFHADTVHAEKPATAVSVRVEGVSNATAAHLTDQALLSAGVPLRAYGVPSGTGAHTGSDAVVPLEVILDEAGNVAYSDRTGAPGMPGNWFARKLGEPLGGPDAAIRGARKLIEEVATDAYARIQAKMVDVKTDSEDRTK